LTINDIRKDEAGKCFTRKGKQKMKSFKDLQTEATKQTKKGVIAKAARKGTPPYTVVVLDRLNKVVKQETTQVADAVPAFVHELQKRYPRVTIKFL